MSKHHFVTKEYAENRFGGFMICGINFGYSKHDANLDIQDDNAPPESPSFFSDKAVNKTRFRDRVLTWMSGWGLEFATKDGLEGQFERSFLQTNWLDSQTHSVDSDEPINVNTLVERASSFLELLEERRPSVIFFIGRDPMEALNDIRLRESVSSILGHRSGRAKVFTADIPGYSGKKWKMLFQSFGDTLIVGLPHPQTRGVTDAYMAALIPPAQVMQILRARKELHENNSLKPSHDHNLEFGENDPLFLRAKVDLPDNQEYPVSYLQRKFLLGYSRAVQLYEAIIQTRRQSISGG